MRRQLLIVATAGLMACGRDTVVGPVVIPPPPPPSTFVVFGIVRDEGGRPLSGARAELIEVGRVAVSNDSGLFSFTDVRGLVTIRIGKEGYASRQQVINVTTDFIWHVSLARPLLVDSLILGQAIQSSVEANAPPCDPAGWDANAPCRRFAFLAPNSGGLVVTVSWGGGFPELDVTIVTEAGGYLNSSSSIGAGQVVASARVEAGRRYEVRVNSYYGGQDFELRADLFP